MIKTEFLIIGQGISGTFLSWYLYKAGCSFIVIDHYDESSSSRVAAGIINPVTGRRIVKTWMIDELLPFALSAYEELGQSLGINAISRKKTIDFFPSVQMLNAFTNRVQEEDQYLLLPDDTSAYTEHFNYDFGYGEIAPCYIVNMQDLLARWRGELRKKSILSDEKFVIDSLEIHQNNKGISYKDISADKIIFCDGIFSSTNKYFKNLPFALNKGEALIVESDILPQNDIYKKGITLAPMGNKLFWTGSSHEWNFIDNQPSKYFLERTTGILKQWLKHPFKVVSQLASIRPATIERRPFAGSHPHHPSIAIFNGMGTKGCSLAPYFAKQLTDHLTKNTPILPEADVKRYSRILNTPQ